MKHLLSFLLFLSTSLHSATFEFIYRDAPGFGFNDNAPRNPINGNTGTTLGLQRRQVLEEAARIWGNHLESNIPIRVFAGFDNFGCTAFGATLASAGPFFTTGNFPNSPMGNTIYPTALANSLANFDTLPSSNDITVNVNSALDSDPNCFGTYYYGLDRSPTGGTVDLLSVLLHELGHGLGFTSLVNEVTGSLGASSPDIFTRFIRDAETGEDWVDMTNAERVASATNSGNVIWTGASTRAAASRYLQPGNNTLLTFENSLSIPDIQSFAAAFGPSITNGLSSEIVLIDDGSTLNPNGGTPLGTITDGCQSPFLNADNIAGNIALIDRGLCNFTDKAIRAEQAGAIAVIIANNVTGPLGIGGSAPFPSIPTVGISLLEGNSIKAALANGPVLAQFQQSNIGTNNGFAQLFAPSPVQSGSSISHFDSIASPNLLMEPSNSSDIDDTLDLTLPLFRDIGWNVVNIPIPHETYDLWVERVFPPNSINTGILEDFDSDEVNNFSEYAFGSDPTDGSIRPESTNFDYLTSTAIPFSYQRNSSPVDVDYLLQESIDLSNWIPVLDERFTQDPLVTPINNEQNVNINITDSSNLKFYRIEATKLPNP